ncbi:hypothetical protein PYCC9005_004427 [Savitreella phatthalungensis]
MQFASTLFALAGAATAASIQGNNFGATHTDGSAMTQADFESLFAAQKNLPGTNGRFNSARLYTTVQAGTANTPSSAIPAAIAQDTTLLLGLWASGGQTTMTNEIAALKAAIQQYGSAFTSRVVGVSVGSEDLYRDSATGQKNKAGIGAGPAVVIDYINQVRSALAGTALSSAPITHVDTFNAWTNGTNVGVVQAVDFISMDAYPYFQSEMTNGIDQGKALFQTAYAETLAASQGKPIWVTETGWPVSGPTEGLAVPSTQNAKAYWDAVGCGLLFGQVNTYWYTLQDASPQTPAPSFGLVPSGSPSQQPLFDLTCPVVAAGVAAVAATSSTAASATSQTPSSSSAEATRFSIQPIAPGPVIISSSSRSASAVRSFSTAPANSTLSSAMASSSGSAAGGATVGGQATTTAATSTRAVSSAASSSGLARPSSGASLIGAQVGGLIAAGLVAALA